MALDPVAATLQLVAATGPVTAFVEDAAASVGAGMVLGGFLGGLLGLAAGAGAPERERAVLLIGSFVGLVMAVGLVVEAILR